MAWHWFNSFSLLKSSCLKTSSFDKDLITYNLSKPSKMKYQVLKESSVRNVCCPLMAGNHSQTNSNRKIGIDLFSLQSYPMTKACSSSNVCQQTCSYGEDCSYWISLKKIGLVSSVMKDNVCYPYYRGVCGKSHTFLSGKCFQKIC